MMPSDEPRGTCCGVVYLYSPSFREHVFSKTPIHPPAYPTVRGRGQAGLFSQLPRRVLLGNPHSPDPVPEVLRRALRSCDGGGWLFGAMNSDGPEPLMRRRTPAP